MMANAAHAATKQMPTPRISRFDLKPLWFALRALKRLLSPDASTVPRRQSVQRLDSPNEQTLGGVCPRSLTVPSS